MFLVRLRLIRWFKNPALLFLLLILPLGGHLFLSQIFKSPASGNIEVGLCLLEDSKNQAFIESFSEEPLLSVTSTDLEKALSLLKEGRIVAAYEFTKPLSAIQSLKDLNGSIRVHHLPQETAIMGASDLISNHLLHLFMPELAIRELSEKAGPEASLHFQREYEKRKDAFALILTPVTGSFALKKQPLPLQKGSAISLGTLFLQMMLLFYAYFKIQETQSGSYKRLHCAGVGALQIQLTDLMLITFLCFFLLLFQVLLWQGFILLWHLPLLLLVGLVHGSATLFFGSLFSSEALFLRLSVFLVLLLGFLGGGFIAAEGFPALLKWTSFFSHIYWQNEALRMIFESHDPGNTFLLMGPLLGFALFYFCFSLFQTQRKMGK